MSNTETTFDPQADADKVNKRKAKKPAANKPKRKKPAAKKAAKKVAKKVAKPAAKKAVSASVVPVLSEAKLYPKKKVLTKLKNNGIRRPKIGTKSGQLWETMDGLLEADGRVPTHAEIKEACSKLRFKDAENPRKKVEPSPTFVASQICLWRRYYKLGKTQQGRQFGQMAGMAYTVPTTKAELAAVQKAEAEVLERHEARKVVGGSEVGETNEPKAKPKVKAKAKPAAKKKAPNKKKPAAKKPAAKKPRAPKKVKATNVVSKTEEAAAEEAWED